MSALALGSAEQRDAFRDNRDRCWPLTRFFTSTRAYLDSSGTVGRSSTAMADPGSVGDRIMPLHSQGAEAELSSAECITFV